MRSLRRYLQDQIEHDLERKMVFVSGPRQVGKTTLARSLPEGRSGYLNWDIADDRERILKRQLPFSPMWIFDEIHKYHSWRDYLKGLYDGRGDDRKILVTGSARLDFYRYSGDSLQGRYFLHRLHPLSVAELGIENGEDFQTLLELGGFPEPFFSASKIEARRWSRAYRQLLIHEEIRSLERIQDLGNLELLMLRLPELVGSLLSINALREDLRVAHKTVESWVGALERLYSVFRIAPFGAPGIRAVKKARKLYLFDWTLVTDPAARFENLVAVHLLKWVHWKQDSEGLDLELRYLRDTDGREVDFVVCLASQPQMLVECKWSEGRLDRSLRYASRRFPGCPAWQISAVGTKDSLTPEGIRIAPAPVFLKTLI